MSEHGTTSEHPAPPPRPDEDALARLLAHLREEAPEGLDDRVLAALRDPRTAERFRRADLDEGARRVLRASFGALAAAGLLVGVLLAREGTTAAPAEGLAAASTSDEPSLLLVPTPTSISSSWLLEAR